MTAPPCSCSWTTDTGRLNAAVECLTTAVAALDTAKDAAAAAAATKALKGSVIEAAEVFGLDAEVPTVSVDVSSRADEITDDADDADDAGDAGRPGKYEENRVYGEKTWNVDGQTITAMLLLICWQEYTLACGASMGVGAVNVATGIMCMIQSALFMKPPSPHPTPAPDGAVPLTYNTAPNSHIDWVPLALKFFVLMPAVCVAKFKADTQRLNGEPYAKIPKVIEDFSMAFTHVTVTLSAATSILADGWRGLAPKGAHSRGWFDVGTTVGTQLMLNKKVSCKGDAKCDTMVKFYCSFKDPAMVMLKHYAGHLMHTDPTLYETMNNNVDLAARYLFIILPFWMSLIERKLVTDEMLITNHVFVLCDVFAYNHGTSEGDLQMYQAILSNSNKETIGITQRYRVTEARGFSRTWLFVVLCKKGESVESVQARAQRLFAEMVDTFAFSVITVHRDLDGLGERGRNFRGALERTLESGLTLNKRIIQISEMGLELREMARLLSEAIGEDILGADFDAPGSWSFRDATKLIVQRAEVQRLLNLGRPLTPEEAALVKAEFIKEIKPNMKRVRTGAGASQLTQDEVDGAMVEEELAAGGMAEGEEDDDSDEEELV